MKEKEVEEKKLEEDWGKRKRWRKNRRRRRSRKRRCIYSFQCFERC